MLRQLIGLVKPDVSTEAKLTGITLFVGKALDSLDSRLRTQEIKKLMRGEKGEQGKQGIQGERGKDGKNGVNGTDGIDGKDGKSGKSGKNGVSVVDTWIAADGHLVTKLSDGKEIDAGDLKSLDGRTGTIISTQLPNNQVYVSATAPSNPSINDLWYDIA